MYNARIFLWFVPFQKCHNGGKTRNIYFFLILSPLDIFFFSRLCFLNQIWHSSYGFEKKKESKGTSTQRDIFFYFKTDLVFVFVFFYWRERTYLLQFLLFQKYERTNSQNVQYFTWHTSVRMCTLQVLLYSLITKSHSTEWYHSNKWHRSIT